MSLKLNKEFLKAAILIIVVTAALYANSLKNPFIWDDVVVIEKNDFTRSLKNLPSLFSPAYLTDYRKIERMDFYTKVGSGETSYRPVTTASYFLDYSIWKLKPFGYHLSNLLLHIFNAILLFIFIRLAVNNYHAALLTALLFALHPVNAEPVGVISFREDLLAFFFYLSSLILYIKRHRCLSLILFFFALLSKEMAVTLPLILILYDYFFTFGQSVKELLKNFKSRYLGYILVLLFYLFVSFLVIGYSGFSSESGFIRFLAAPKVFLTYLEWLVFPINIHVTLPDITNRFLITPAVIFGIAGFLLSIILAIKFRKKSARVCFAVFWFLVTLLPVSNVFPLMNYIAARYLYVPSVGFCLLAAVLILKLKKYFTSLPLLILAVYFMFSFVRSAVWKDNIIIWSEMVKFYPKNALAHSGLAASLRAGLQLDEAIEEYRHALKLDPAYAKDYSNLGSALGEKGLYEEAITCFKQAIKLDPGYISAYNNLGITYARMKKFDEAKNIWQKALKISPDDFAINKNLIKLKKILPPPKDANED